MKRQRIICAILIIALLAWSYPMLVISQTAPTASVDGIVCDGSVLTGKYSYNGDDEGTSTYRWYLSDDFFTRGTAIEGATNLTLRADKSMEGKFISFGITPVNSEGTSGTEIFSAPVMLNEGYYSDFSQVSQEIECVASANGAVEAVNSPDDSTQKVLSVYKPHTDSYKTEARINVGNFNSELDVVDVDLYVDELSGTTELFGIYNGDYGLVFKVYIDSAGNLCYRGGNGKKTSMQAIQEERWYHFKFNVNSLEHKIEAYVDGNSIINGDGQEDWRYVNNGFNNVAVYFMNYGNGGKVFVRNLSVTKTDSLEKAQADLATLDSLIPAETEEDISLETTGSNGSRIFYESNSSALKADGTVTRPQYNESDIEVTLTAYVINGANTLSKNYSISIPKLPEPPEAVNVKITQKKSRPVEGSYTFYDATNYEGTSEFGWYVENGNTYEKIDGETEMIFIPSQFYDGKNIKFGVTPVNELGVKGEEVLSEAHLYKYYDTKLPVAKIRTFGLTATGFSATYTYTSEDYLKEGSTEIKWYSADDYNGEYVEVVNNNEPKTEIKEVSSEKYYKLSITPVDEEGNRGITIWTQPAVFVEEGTNSTTALQDALALLNFDENIYTDQTFIRNADGVRISWESKNPQVLANDGTITRASKDGEDAEVLVTVYITSGTETKSKSIKFNVKKYTNKPTLSELLIIQNGRPISASYAFADIDGDTENGTTYQWYKKAPDEGEYTAIEGATNKLYAPPAVMDGYSFKVSVTPCDSSYTAGESCFSEEYVYEYRDPAKPTAQMKKIQIGLMSATGAYEYNNIDGIGEGNSQYKWYISDSLLGGYSEISGMNTQTMEFDASDENKFIKFSVVPFDEEGVKGDETFSEPAQIKFGDKVDFESGGDLSTYNITVEGSGGEISVTTDPQDENNHVLMINRTSNATGTKNRFNCTLPPHQNTSGMIVEADVYVDSSLDGVWNMFYLTRKETSYTYFARQKGSDLYINEDTSAVKETDSFTKGQWHHIAVVLDYSGEEWYTKGTYFDNVKVKGAQRLRDQDTRVTLLYSFLENGATGKVYIDNIRTTMMPDYSGLAKADADALVIEGDTTAVTKRLTLPVSGTVNNSNIIWQSSDEGVISSSGVVTRPSSQQGDKDVTLTAHVINGNDYVTKTFNLTVLRILNDEEMFNADFEALSDYDGILIDRDIELPTIGEFRTSYTWDSLSDEIMSDSGELIYRSSQKCDVKFSVHAENSGYEDDKIVTFTVVPEHGEDLLASGMVKTSSQDIKNVATNLKDNDYFTAWSSLSNDATPIIVIDLGKTKNFNEILLSDKEISVEKIQVLVSQDNSEWHEITASSGRKNICNIKFSTQNARYIKLILTPKENVVTLNEIKVLYNPVTVNTDNVNDITLSVQGNVTASFTLPQSLASGTLISWQSSNSNAIEISGSTAVVKRAASNVTVTLTATVNISGKNEEKKFVLTVTGTSNIQEPPTDGGGGSGGSGGSVSPKPSTGITAGGTMNNEQTQPVTSKTSFKDIEAVIWAKEAIETLTDIGVINGTSPQTFEPNRSITRAEFATIIYRAMKFDELEVKETFKDVKATDWYYNSITQLCSLGIVNGIGDDSFGVNDNISRQDMALIIYRAAKFRNIEFSYSQTEFEDDNMIADYAKDAVKALSGEGIVNGQGNNLFNPSGNATRAEAAVILSRILKKTGGLS